jgi:AcrR family transcriptional regulator
VRHGRSSKSSALNAVRPIPCHLPARRTRVLDAALPVFARYGYRKASMDDVAKAADISRPGLYFSFSSKPELFRAAVEQALDDSVTAAQLALADPDRPLRERLIEAFDHWSGR